MITLSQLSSQSSQSCRIVCDTTYRHLLVFEADDDEVIEDVFDTFASVDLLVFDAKCKVVNFVDFVDAYNQLTDNQVLAICNQVVVDNSKSKTFKSFFEFLRNSDFEVYADFDFVIFTVEDDDFESIDQFV